MVMFGRGLRATPQQDAFAEEMTKRLGLGVPADDQAAVAQYAAMPVQQAPERWINGGKFTGKDALGLALGSIGDAFARNAGGEAVVAPMVFNGISGARKAAQAAQMAQAKRQQDWEDWQRQYEYERANPKPSNNDTRNDYDYIKGILGEEAANNFLRNKTDPTVSIPLPGGQTYVGPRSSIPGAQAPSGVPTISDGASYDALQPGQQYRDPQGNLRTKGGPSQPATGGFRTDIPSGSPLDPRRR